MVSLEKYLKESLIRHLVIEEYSEWPVFEVDGCPIQLKSIVDDIIDQIKCNKKDFLVFADNMPFKVINIVITEDWYHLAYDFSKSDYKNGIIYIDIGIPYNHNYTEYIDSIESLLQHELVHAIDDFSRYNKGYKLFKDIFNDKYSKSLKNIYSSDKIKQILYKAEYFLNDQERNAYLSQLKGDIEKICQKHNYNRNNFNFDELYNELKELPLWKLYLELGDLLMNIDGYDHELIKTIYNNLYNTDYNFNKIKRELLNKWIKFKNKFEHLIPNICFRYLDKPKFSTVSFKI